MVALAVPGSSSLLFGHLQFALVPLECDVHLTPLLRLHMLNRALADAMSMIECNVQDHLRPDLALAAMSMSRSIPMCSQQDAHPAL